MPEWSNELYNDIRTYAVAQGLPEEQVNMIDRKSTRLNSSHGYISYAVFCLKKQNKQKTKKKKKQAGSPQT